jgi:SAM-dependent methyltransferase
MTGGDDGERRIARRGIFDEAAELYDRVRPSYPTALVDDLVALSGIPPTARVLEIGIGTGQLTRPLAERGYEIVGVELGAGLAAVARRNLEPFPSVTVVNAAFEEWELPRQQFDLVVAASSFHWLDPEMRVTKAADALRPRGALATIGTNHVAGGTEAFFVDVMACYERWDPTDSTGWPGYASPLPQADGIRSDSDELDRSGRFGPATFRRHLWDETYSSAGYIETLLTYSGHRALDEEPRAGLLECIRELIDTHYGGRIAKRYLFELRLANLRS